MLQYKQATSTKLTEALTEMGVEIPPEPSRKILWALYKENYVAPEAPDSKVSDEIVTVEQGDSSVRTALEAIEKQSEAVEAPAGPLVVEDEIPLDIGPIKLDPDLNDPGKILKICLDISTVNPVVGRTPKEVAQYCTTGYRDYKIKATLQFWFKGAKAFSQMSRFNGTKYAAIVDAANCVWFFYTDQPIQAMKSYKLLCKNFPSTMTNMSSTRQEELLQLAKEW